MTSVKDQDTPATGGAQSPTHADLEEMREAWLRARADLENERKRRARLIDDTVRRERIKLLREVLPVVDGIELAVAAAAGAESDRDPRGGAPGAHVPETPVPETHGVAEGLEMVLDEARKFLARNRVETIDPVDEPFDPNLHEAVKVHDVERVPHHTVLQVYQKGYRIDDLLVRPARVVVSNGDSAA